MTSPSPARPSLTDPAILIATWGGAGYLPKAPGTWGSLLALPFAFLIAILGGGVALFVASLLAFAVGLWASDKYLAKTGSEDPSEIVIDEVAALWLLLAFAPPNLIGWLVGFVVFRFLDIKKIWPINVVEQRFSGAWGVMLDDVVAAGYVIIIFVFTTLMAGLL